jgi:hypothetical protein
MTSANGPWQVLIAASIGLVAVGCDGTETGNPSANPALRRVVVALQLDSATIQTEERKSTKGKEKEEETEAKPGTLQLQTAWLATESLSFSACSGPDYAALPPGAWDLLRLMGHGFDTDVPSFCSATFRTGPADTRMGRMPPELSGLSLWLTGTRADGVPFEVRSTASLDVTVDTPDAPLTAPEVILTLDPAVCLPVSTIDSLDPDADGVVRVSPDSNTWVLDRLESSFAEGAGVREAGANETIVDDCPATD